MSSPFAWSSFLALITGGMKAPSDGALKITMESFSSGWAWHGAAAATSERCRSACKVIEPHGYHHFLHLNLFSIGRQAACSDRWTLATVRTGPHALRGAPHAGAPYHRYWIRNSFAASPPVIDAT